jgi:hypothetical protein
VTGAVTIKPAPVPRIIRSAAEIAQMPWLARLIRRRSGRDAPHVHDFGGAIGNLPMIRSPEPLRLDVFTDGRIELDERPLRIEDLEAVLKSAYRPGAVVFCSCENPGEVSQVNVEVIKCVCRLGLPLAFPAEATPVLYRILQDRSSAEQRRPAQGKPEVGRQSFEAVCAMDRQAPRDIVEVCEGIVIAMLAGAGKKE